MGAGPGNIPHPPDNTTDDPSLNFTNSADGDMHNGAGKGCFYAPNLVLGTALDKYETLSCDPGFYCPYLNATDPTTVPVLCPPSPIRRDSISSTLLIEDDVPIPEVEISKETLRHDLTLLSKAFKDTFPLHGQVRMNFRFEGLELELKNGRKVLEGVTGRIREGTMTAILGPSGAGKTTFMNVLMGKVEKTGGKLLINGQESEVHLYRKIIGYVPQEDIMLHELTVRENVLHSARVRLPRSWNEKKIQNHVDNVLLTLKLSHVAHSVIGDETTRGISGGQRKRVNIAMELAAAPLTIFLDEPTSGLDSTSALDVTDILSSMATLGITIIAVIHQPRIEIFEKFHDVIMVAPGGRVAYMGPVPRIKPYFQALGFEFEQSANVSDVVMDILAGKGVNPVCAEGKLGSDQVVELWEDRELRKAFVEGVAAQRRFMVTGAAVAAATGGKSGGQAKARNGGCSSNSGFSGSNSRSGDVGKLKAPFPAVTTSFGHGIYSGSNSNEEAHGDANWNMSWGSEDVNNWGNDGDLLGLLTGGTLERKPKHHQRQNVARVRRLSPAGIDSETVKKYSTLETPINTFLNTSTTYPFGKNPQQQSRRRAASSTRSQTTNTSSNDIPLEVLKHGTRHQNHGHQSDFDEEEDSNHHIHSRSSFSTLVAAPLLFQSIKKYHNSTACSMSRSYRKAGFDSDDEDDDSSNISDTNRYVTGGFTDRESIRYRKQQLAWKQNREFHSIVPIVVEGRGAGFWRQLYHCHQRSLLQQSRKVSAFVLETVVAIIAGVLMGLSTQGKLKELYSGPYFGNCAGMSPKPMDVISLFCFLMGLSVALASAPAAVKVFGEEKSVYWREAASGHSRAAYFLGKTISTIIRIFIMALHFTAVFMLLAKPVISPLTQYVIVLLQYWGVYGMSCLISMVVRRENASLLAVVMCLFASVFCGYGPSIIQAKRWGLSWIMELSFNKWAAEAMYASAVQAKVNPKPNNPKNNRRPEGKGGRKPKPVAVVQGRNLGGRSKAAIEADLARGKAIAAAAKARRDKHRAEAAAAKAAGNSATEVAESVTDSEEQDSDQDEGEQQTKNNEPNDVKRLQQELKPAKTKGGSGKKGKVFSTTTDMLSIINEINSSEESKIEKKLVKRRAVHTIINEKEKIQKKKELEKRQLLEAKKKEILEAQKNKGKKRKPTEEEIEAAANEKPKKRSIGSVIWGKSDAALMQIPSGSLHKVTTRNTATSTQVSKQQLFKDATLMVRRTNTAFNYQLVATRLFEEGEDEDNEDPDSLDDDDTEAAFLLDEELHLLVTDQTVRWSDPLAPAGTLVHYEYEATDASPATLFAFEGVAYTSMYERRAKKNHSDATDDELDKYFAFVRAGAVANANAVAAAAKKVGGLVTGTASPPKQQPKQPQLAQTEKTPGKKGPVHDLKKETTPSQSPVPMSMGTTPLAINKNLTPSGESIVKVEGDLYLYDNRVSQFNLMRETIAAEIIRTARFEFHLIISDATQAYISQPLDNNMNPQFNTHASCFVWLWKQEDGSDTVYPWSIKFADAAQEALFRDAFGACMYEALNRSEFLKVKSEDRGYLVNAYQEDVEMVDAEEEDEERQAAQEEEEEEESEDEGAFMEAHDNSAPGDKSAKITNLTIGHGDRSYFVRGHSIGVLGHPDADSVEYSTVINNVKSLSDNKSFTPSKVLLHDQDQSMLLMRPNEEHIVYRMDLNVGKVVEEWKIDDITPVTEIIPEAKNAGMTPSRNLVGINHNSIFRLDPRQETKLVRSESKTYASNVGKFNCATTTASGKLAVGSSKGDIRLYDKLNVRAKTHLPGLGDPVSGIDTTENGKWVIATCKNYLLLVCTEAKDTKATGRGAVFSGFNKSLGDQKPFPVRLQLRPEHVAYMGGSVSFTPARFNTSSGNNSGEFEETSIVTSTGSFVVTWNFRRVKQGKLNDYTIKQYGTEIVADNFKFGEDKNILVALPEDICMTSRKSLQTPTKMLKSPNPKLFTDDDGLPLRFSVVRYSQREPIRLLIQQNGGIVVEPHEPGIYMKISNINNAQTPGVFYSDKYILDSIQRGRLPVDRERYRLWAMTAVAAGPSSQTYSSSAPPRSTTTTATTHVVAKKGTRNTFTNAEDALLVQLFAKSTAQTSLKGNLIYQELARENPSHTWHSWRDRALKHILPKFTNERLQRLREEHLARTIPPVDAAADPIPTSTTVSPIADSSSSSRVFPATASPTRTAPERQEGYSSINTDNRPPQKQQQFLGTSHRSNVFLNEDGGPSSEKRGANSGESAGIGGIGGEPNGLSQAVVEVHEQVSEDRIHRATTSSIWKPRKKIATEFVDVPEDVEAAEKDVEVEKKEEEIDEEENNDDEDEIEEDELNNSREERGSASPYKEPSTAQHMLFNQQQQQNARLQQESLLSSTTPPSKPTPRSILKDSTAAKGSPAEFERNQQSSPAKRVKIFEPRKEAGEEDQDEKKHQQQEEPDPSHLFLTQPASATKQPQSDSPVSTTVSPTPQRSTSSIPANRNQQQQQQQSRSKISVRIKSPITATINYRERSLSLNPPQNPVLNSFIDFNNLKEQFKRATTPTLTDQPQNTESDLSATTTATTLTATTAEPLNSTASSKRTDGGDGRGGGRRRKSNADELIEIRDEFRRSEKAALLHDDMIVERVCKKPKREEGVTAVDQGLVALVVGGEKWGGKSVERVDQEMANSLARSAVAFSVGSGGVGTVRSPVRRSMRLGSPVQPPRAVGVQQALKEAYWDQTTPKKRASDSSSSNYIERALKSPARGSFVQSDSEEEEIPLSRKQKQKPTAASPSSAPVAVQRQSPIVPETQEMEVDSESDEDENEDANKSFDEFSSLYDTTQPMPGNVYEELEEVDEEGDAETTTEDEDEPTEVEAQLMRETGESFERVKKAMFMSTVCFISFDAFALLRSNNITKCLKKKARFLLRANFDVNRLDVKVRPFIFQEEDDAVLVGDDVDKFRKLEAERGKNMIMYRKMFLDALE
ncbi:UNVERIFIED_CONTAM: hypothetical protein HDU68_010331 [Siphonaria sp. JEL0065]|nr:hypothetical protein HDU68_010331 [Siphonaria sp. JEL0065]